MAGFVPKTVDIETDEEDSDTELSNVFMGPITKEELLAPMKKKKKIPSRPKAQVGAPEVITHINLVTPAKEFGNTTPLDLSVKKSNPMVVDLSTPVASKTILIPDTPKFASFLNESDFMDESDIGISVDNVLVDLTRDIESEMESEMKESDNFTQSILHSKSLFNTTDLLNGTTSRSLNGSHAVRNKIIHNKTTQDTSTHIPINNSNLQINKFENQSPDSQILNDSCLNKNLSQNITSSYLSEPSQITSELSSVLNTTEEQSFVSGKDSSTEDGKSYQDVLSDSFQYYTGPDLNKENDSNQLNHVSNTPLIKEENTHLNQTFEKLSLSQSKTGSVLNISNHPAEDTLEEIDILETYGYKTAEKDMIIPTINILSATVIEESTDHNEDYSPNDKSVSPVDVSAVNNPKVINGEDMLKMENFSESLNEVLEGSNNSTNELDDHIKSEYVAENHPTEIVNPPTEENMEQDDLSMTNISQMLADTSLQTKESPEFSEVVAMETSALNSQSCINIISRDSCVGLYETVNASMGENTDLLCPCPELDEEADDLNLSIIDNTDATNHWKEVNSANNTAYIDLSPIKKNASNQHMFDEVAGEGTHTDHTYAHGEPLDNQSIKSDANSSGNTEEEVVQLIFVNTSKKLLSIVEEHEPMDKEIEEERSKHLEVDISGTGDISMKETTDIPENPSSVGFIPEDSDPLNKTFNEDNVIHVNEANEQVGSTSLNISSGKTETVLEDISNKNEPMNISVLSSENSPTATESIIKTNQSQLENSLKELEEEIKDQHLKTTNVVSEDEKPKPTSSPGKSFSHIVSDNISTVNETTHGEENKLSESLNLKTNENENTVDCAMSKESIQNVDPLITDGKATETDQDSKMKDSILEHVEVSYQKEDVSIQNKTPHIDHCNNTAQETVEHKTIDECDFKSVVQKYEENTGVVLSTTNELPSFNLESFSKPRNLNDDLNTSSPDVGSIKKDVKKSTVKPKSQIPMSHRTNVLRPTKFTTENIKIVPKPLTKQPLVDKSKTLNGSAHKVQKENRTPASPKVKVTPLTPARSISQTLVSSLSSFANKITGRTPRKENTPKIKSPEPLNTKPSKPISHLKSPKPFMSSAKAGIKSPTVSSNFKFTPMLAKFKNVPSSTPAVKAVSKTPTPRHKAPGQEEEKKQVIRKSLSASKVEGQHKTPSSQNKFDVSLNNRKLDFKNIESKIGSIRKPDELPALQKAVKSPSTSTAKPNLIKPPKFTGSKLPSLLPAAMPAKRTSKFMNVQSPIGAYIRDGSKVMNDSKKLDSSFIPRKLMKLNPAERQSSVKTVAVEKKSEDSVGNSMPGSADVSMGESSASLQQVLASSDTIQHTAL